MNTFKPQHKQCYFCAANINSIDYKNTELLRKFTSPQAQIVRKRRTGVCSLHQRMLARAIKHARFLGILSFVTR